MFNDIHDNSCNFSNHTVSRTQSKVGRVHRMTRHTADDQYYQLYEKAKWLWWRVYAGRIHNLTPSMVVCTHNSSNGKRNYQSGLDWYEIIISVRGPGRVRMWGRHTDRLAWMRGVRTCGSTDRVWLNTSPASLASPVPLSTSPDAN